MPQIIALSFCILLAGVAKPRQVRIALYDDSGLPAEVRAEFIRETTRIFRQAGIALSWIECHAAGLTYSFVDCAQSQPGRLMLHLVPGGSKRKETTGFALLQGAAGRYACVYSERVRELARSGQWDFSDLLAHAAAHEIGHLLLRSAAHSNAGVMRTGWKAQELRALTHSGLIFLPGQLGAGQIGDHQPESGEHLP
jgi:hypothetical protein